jgi:hypothetical protein
VGAFSASAIATLLAWGCGSSSEEKLRAAELAGSCSINTDCEDPLVCAFGRCHVECDEDRDCRPLGLRCMNAPEKTDRVGVCQLESEVTCESDRDCPGVTQVCGIDNECRDPCDGDADCTPTQICAKSNECASTDSEYDLLDENGNIVAHGGSGGAAGATSGGGKGGTSSGAGGADAGAGARGSAGAGLGAGGHAGQSGQGGMLGKAGSGDDGEGGAASPGSGGASAGETGTGGEGGSGTAMGGAGEGGAGEGGGAGVAGEFHTERADGIETVDNDTRDTPVSTPLHGRATIHVGSNDHDWFGVTVPDDGSPHVISIVVEQEPTASVLLAVSTLTNYAPVGSNLTYGLGTTGYAYVTAGSGATILFDFSRWAGNASGGLAHISFDVEAENDAHEPNNTKETATEIERDTVYSGTISEPWISDIDRPNQDWYAVDLELGTATIGFTSVPSQGRITVRRTDPLGEPANMGAKAEGAFGDFTSFTVSQAGTYYFTFEPYTGISGIVEGAKPTYLTQPYSFRVTQQ